VIDRASVPNAFEFVVLAGARARQLMRGCTPRVAGEAKRKVEIAQREVLAGEVQKTEVPAKPSNARD
jgi:DNA-directed RNA polymerase subunit K/omega